MATNLVNGVRVQLSAAEEARIRASQAAAKSQADGHRQEAQQKRDAARSRIEAAGLVISDLRDALRS